MYDGEMSEYLVKCPTCQTQTKMVCEEASPVMVICAGCQRVLVMHQNRLFTVPVSAVTRLMRLHRVRPCGNITATKLSAEAKSLVNTRSMEELHDLLERDVDVLDIIRSL